MGERDDNKEYIDWEMRERDDDKDKWRNASGDQKKKNNPIDNYGPDKSHINGGDINSSKTTQERVDERRFKMNRDHWKDKATWLGCLDKEAVKVLQWLENKDSKS